MLEPFSSWYFRSEAPELFETLHNRTGVISDWTCRKNVSIFRAQDFCDSIDSLSAEPLSEVRGQVDVLKLENLLTATALVQS